MSKGQRGFFKADYIADTDSHMQNDKAVLHDVLQIENNLKCIAIEKER
jgi:hypothetical protein